MGTQPRPDAGKTRLKPGDTYHYPTCFIGCYQGEVDDGCNRLHRWVETHLRPPMPWGVTPVLVNNSWGSGMAVDETLARKMIDDCAALGIELYQVDAGWYQDVGNWYPNPEKFPRGLAPVSDYAHSKGLKFGLWIGWTQGGSSRADDPKVLSVFNPAQRELVRPRPAERLEEPGLYRRAGLPRRRAGTRLVPRGTAANRQGLQARSLGTRSGHDARRVLAAPATTIFPAILSTPAARRPKRYYDIYDQLRRENPGLMFEDCVNGGRLVDYGVIKRVHYICVTDAYDPAHLSPRVLRQQLSAAAEHDRAVS